VDKAWVYIKTTLEKERGGSLTTLYPFGEKGVKQRLECGREVTRHGRERKPGQGDMKSACEDRKLGGKGRTKPGMGDESPALKVFQGQIPKRERGARKTQKKHRKKDEEGVVQPLQVTIIINTWLSRTKYPTRNKKDKRGTARGPLGKKNCSSNREKIRAVNGIVLRDVPHIQTLH